MTRRSNLLDDNSGSSTYLMRKVLQPLEARSQSSHLLVSLSYTYLVPLAVLFATLYFGASIFMPITVAFFIRCLLIKPVRWLQRRTVPSAIAALLVLGIFFGSLAVLSAQLIVPASQSYRALPNQLHQVQERIRSWKASFTEVTESAKELEKITNISDSESVPTVNILQPSLLETLALQSGTVLLSLAFIILLSYFFLAYGDELLEKMRDRFGKGEEVRKKESVMHEIEQAVLYYISTISIINVVLALCLTGVLYMYDLPNPVLWGVLGGIANFIPFIGIFVVTALVTVVTIASFPIGWITVLVPSTFFAVSAIEGNFITPTLLGKRFTLNPALVFLWLTVWSWLWGPIGALIAVPILVSCMIMYEGVVGLGGRSA